MTAETLPLSSPRHTRLPNGLDIITLEDHSAPVVSLQAWCGVGSIHEDHWLGAGLSHILEHMLFKGTARRPGVEIAAAVQDAGGYINAYTSFDRTVYWIDAPSEGTATCLDVLMDVMMNAALPEDEYAKEQEVIRREFAMCHDDPDRMSSQLLFATAFQRHPYGNPVIGHMDVFDRLTREDVLAYYRRHYVPNNMLFVVVGDLDGAQIEKTLAAYFQDYPRRPLAPLYIPREPSQLGRRAAHLEFETQLSKLHLAWPIPDVTHADMPALDVLAAILGEGRSSRLYREVRENQRLAHSIGAYSYTPAHGGLFAISATTDGDKRRAAEEAALAVVEALKKDGVSEGDLEKARKSCLVDTLDDLTTMRGQANDLATNWMLTRNLEFSRQYLREVGSVIADDVQRVARRYLTEGKLTSVSLNPKGSLQAKNGGGKRAAKAETVKLTLRKGVVLLARRDPRVPLVFSRATMLAGLLAETAATSGITKLCAKTLLKGTASRSAEEIAATIENVGGSIGATGGNNTYSISLHHLRDDLELGLDLLTDVILRPSFPDEKVAQEKETQIAGIKAEQDHLVSLAVRRLRARLFAGHPYACVADGTEESVASLTAKQVAQFHQRHAVAGNAIFAVHGDVDVDEVAKLLEQRLATLPAGKPGCPTANDLAAEPQSGQISLPTDKSQAVLVMGFPGVSVTSPDRLAVELIDEACSDMASRLFLRIREEMGLAYFVSASQMIGLRPGAFYFYLGTDPAKLDDVQAALIDEIAKLAEGGLTERELERAKKTRQGKSAIEKQSLSTVGMLESLDELYGLGFNHAEEEAKALAEIDLATIRAACGKYFGQAKPVIVRVSPGLR